MKVIDWKLEIINDINLKIIKELDTKGAQVSLWPKKKKTMWFQAGLFDVYNPVQYTDSLYSFSSSEAKLNKV